jgi:hypothetical protein
VPGFLVHHRHQPVFRIRQLPRTKQNFVVEMLKW